MFPYLFTLYKSQLKICENLGGSFCPLTFNADIGGVIVNSAGMMIAAYYGWTAAAHSLESELQALLKGLG